MNKQRKVLITVTYNEMGIIIDTKAEEVAQPNLQQTCNQLATDCISRQAAINVITEYADRLQMVNWQENPGVPYKAYTLNWFVNTIRDLPSADVTPVRHGYWRITDAYPHNVYCSECYKTFAQTHWAVWEDGSLPRQFCPSCGARMDGEQNG